LLIGATCPLVGVFLVLRRMAFLGVALPQVSAAGIAFALCLPALGIAEHGHAGHFEGDQQLCALAGSLTFSLVAILVLALLERRGGWVEGRIGTVYVLAGAWGILFVAKNPLAERGMLNLMQGEIIAVSDFDLALTASAFGVVGIALYAFRREFLLVSYDREMAVTLGKNVVLWDVGLYLLIGCAISIAVLTSGPLVAFGFLLLPPLIAHLFAGNMRQFWGLAAIMGALAALAGFCVAYRLDLPLGPVNVALLGCMYGLAFLLKKLVSRGN
jgi:ABC-type Mn2+/Zn2+ transport system permease subunit